MNKIMNIKNNDNLRIIVSLTKLDNYKTRERNVVASIVQYPYELNLDAIKKSAAILGKHTKFFVKCHFHIICLDFDFLEGETPTIYQDSYITISKFNIFTFFHSISSEPLGYETLFKTLNKSIIKPNNGPSKSNNTNFNNKRYLCDNSGYINVIFVFKDMTWSNILLVFKTIGVTIFGGSSSRRHLLSSVQLNLVKFLQLLDNNFVDKNIIYKSFSEISTSNSKLDKRVEYLIKNYPETKGELLDIKQNISNDVEYYLLFNSFLRWYIQILALNNDVIKLKLDNENLNKIILEAEEKISNLDQKGYGISQYTKKLNSSNKLIKASTEKIQENSTQIVKIESEIQEIINRLYLIDSNFFDENKVYKFNAKWKVDLNESCLGPRT